MTDATMTPAPDDRVRQLTVEIQTCLSALDRAERDVSRSRLQVGTRLLTLRKWVEASGESWWQYFGANFSRSRRDAEKMMALARSDDPEGAAKIEREYNRRQQEAHRVRRSIEQSAAYVSRMNLAPVKDGGEGVISILNKRAEGPLRRPERIVDEVVQSILDAIWRISPAQYAELYEQLPLPSAFANGLIIARQTLRRL